MKNAYVRKLTAAKRALKNEERKRVINRTITTLFQASAVALHEQFGFGAERIERFREAMEQVVLEYGDLMDDVDTDYADGKLEQRYLQIMGSDSHDTAESTKDL